jgi:hypothetical protein
VAADHFSTWVFAPTEVAPAERAYFEALTQI